MIINSKRRVFIPKAYNFTAFASSSLFDHAKCTLNQENKQNIPLCFNGKLSTKSSFLKSLLYEI